MALKIRLARRGAANDPFFRVVVCEKHRSTKGKVIETVGWYDPELEENNFNIKMDRIEYWQSVGAHLSDSVKSLLKRYKRIMKSKQNVKRSSEN